MIRCCVCAKQAVNGQVSLSDPFLTTLIGSRAGFRIGECFCGYCVPELDENGNFLEEVSRDNAIEVFE